MRRMIRPSRRWRNSVRRATAGRLPASTSAKYSAISFLALLTVEHLFQLAKPFARHIFSFTLAVGRHQHDLSRPQPEEVDNPSAATLAFGARRPSNLPTPSRFRDDVTGLRKAAE